MTSIRNFQCRKLFNPTLPIDGGGLKQQRGTDLREIGALVFRCPMTQWDIKSGIEMDRCTFVQIGQFSVQVHCRACRNRHEFKVAGGTLASVRPIHQPNGEIEFELSLSD